MTHKLMLKLFGPIRIYRFSGKSKEKEEMKFSAKKRKKRCEIQIDVQKNI